MSSNTGMAQASDKSPQPFSTECLPQKNVLSNSHHPGWGPRAPHWSICARHLEVGIGIECVARCLMQSSHTALNAFHHVHVEKDR